MNIKYIALSILLLPAFSYSTPEKPAEKKDESFVTWKKVAVASGVGALATLAGTVYLAVSAFGGSTRGSMARSRKPSILPIVLAGVTCKVLSLTCIGTLIYGLVKKVTEKPESAENKLTPATLK